MKPWPWLTLRNMMASIGWRMERKRVSPTTPTTVMLVTPASSLNSWPLRVLPTASSGFWKPSLLAAYSLSTTLTPRADIALSMAGSSG